jgi:phosphinothricin acetyltransferase
VATSLKARPAELTDARVIAEIYNQGIEDRTATFETAPRTAEAVEGLLQAREDRYPAVVVEDGPQVLGFAWTSEYRPRSAYGARGGVRRLCRSRRARSRRRPASHGSAADGSQRRGFWKLVSRIFRGEHGEPRALRTAGLFSNVSNARMARSAPLASGDARVIVERLLGAAGRD